MVPRIGWAVVALVCAVLLVACQRSPTTAPAADDPSTGRAGPDQSAVFFPGVVDSYGLDVTQADRDHLADLYARRQIDPCGFVDRNPAALRGHKDYSYTHTAVRELLVDGDWRHTLAGDGCGIAFPGSEIGLLLRIWPGDPGGYTGGSPFAPDPSHPGVTMSTTWGKCTFRVVVPLTDLAGAPGSMRDPLVQVTPMDVASGRWNMRDTSLCPLAGALAGDIAGQLGDMGIPVYRHGGTVAARFLTSDPCATAADLPMEKYVWSDPSPQAQWPTTWRHPGTCELKLAEAGDASDAGWAVTRHGLAVWPELIDDLVDPSTGRPAIRTEQDGIVLYDLTGRSETGCRGSVVAKSDVSITPTAVGAGAPGLGESSPIVVLMLSMAGRADCGEIARRAARAAITRGTG